MNHATVDHLLTTTRSVRKRLDLTRPVEPEVIKACLDIAIQAPTGSNAQGWHFMVITDPEQRGRVAEFYKKSFGIYLSRPGPIQSNEPEMTRVRESAIYLWEHMQEVPVLIIPCIEGRVETSTPSGQATLYASILPATWSLMLALRSRGLGSTLTTSHLRYEKTVAELLGIPDTITQAGMIAIAYYTGDDFKPAERRPATEFTYWNRWGARE
jgi:nitroreductase